jgi:hypothetical protein
MMGVTAQIATAIIALVLTLVAAYIVFLSTSQANTEAQILEEGARIVELLRKSPAQQVQIPYLDMFLRQHYQQKHPDLSGAALLYGILFEANLSSGLVNKNLEIEEVGAKGNAPGELTSRITLWVVQESFTMLAPSGVSRPVYSISRSYGPNPDISPGSQEAVFPFGLLGVEHWLREFRIVEQTVSLANIFPVKDSTVENIKKFLSDGPEFYRSFQKYDYGDWLTRMEQAVAVLAEHATRVSSLLRLRDNFSIQTKLPSLKWLLPLGSILLLAGVVIPLLIVGLGDEKQVPPQVNIATLGVVLVISITAIWLLAVDITRSPEEQFASIRYFMPLQKQLVSDAQKEYSEVTFSFDLISGILADSDRLGLSPKEVKLLSKYRDAIRNSNLESDAAATELGTQFQASQILKKYKAPLDSGGTGFPILSPFSTNQIEIKPNTTVIVQANRGRVTTDIIKTNVLEENLNEVQQEFAQIYEGFRGQAAYKSLVQRRDELRHARQELLTWLARKIGQ